MCVYVYIYMCVCVYIYVPRFGGHGSIRFRYPNERGRIHEHKAPFRKQLSAQAFKVGMKSKLTILIILINLQKCQQFCVFLSIWGAVCTLMRKKNELK